jgi:hypothetical protein
MYNNDERLAPFTLVNHPYIIKYRQSVIIGTNHYRSTNMSLAFLKKWWVESDFKAPNLPLSLRLKVSGCHYNSIYNNT